MRLLLLGAAVVFVAAPASAQQAAPSPRATYVQPHHAGEAVRVTTYAERPAGRGRLAARYRGIRVNRTERAAPRLVTNATPAAPTFDSPRHSFVRRGGSFFQVIPAR